MRRIATVARRRANVYFVCLNNNILVDPRERALGRLIKPIKLLEELVLEVRRLLDALFQLLEGRPRHVADSDVVRRDGLCGKKPCPHWLQSSGEEPTPPRYRANLISTPAIALENQYRATS